MGDLVVLEDNVSKKKEFDKLNIEYLELFQMKEDIIFKKGVYIENRYMSIFGALIYRKLEATIEYRKLNKKLCKIIESINRGEDFNLTNIENDINKELEEFYKELNDMREKLKSSKEFFKLPALTEEETKEIKSIFRRVAKKVHPDINKNLSKEELEIWYSFVEAYENNDLIALIILEGAFNLKDIKESISYNNLDKKIDDLKGRITDISNYIKKINNIFPMNLKDKIDNEEFIKEYKERLIKDIEIQRDNIQVVNKKIKAVMGE